MRQKHHVTERLTKKRVLDEVNALRDTIRLLATMDDNELLDHFNHCLPNTTIPETGRGIRVEMTKRLLISATFHLTNVLNLE